MSNRFQFTDECDQRLRITPVEREHPDEAPALWFETTDGGFRGTSVKVPLGKLEEVVAGQRDMARQAGGQTESVTVRFDLGAAAGEAVRNAVRKAAGLRVELGEQDVTKHLADPAAEILRIVSTAATEAEQYGDTDISDLVDRLKRAGYSMPDTDGPAR